MSQMIEMEPITIARGLRYLVPSRFESALLGSHIYTRKDSGWTPAAKRRGLLFDLSRVEYVDLGAVVQLVLLIESALRDGLNVVVATPIVRFRYREQLFLAERSDLEAPLARRLARRVKCLKFLRYIRFFDALQAPHFQDFPGSFEIFFEFDPKDKSESVEELIASRPESTSPVDDVATIEHEEALYRYCFPLTWLDGSNVGKYQEIGRFLAAVLGERSRGLAGPDAQTIANVILHELVENVLVHSETSRWALVAALARPSTAPMVLADVLKSEQEYFHWCSQQEVPMVDVVIGDSGIGVPTSLMAAFRQRAPNLVAKKGPRIHQDAEVMRWAFDRWSTRRSSDLARGTRGLYRVDRVVKKYQGLVTIRSEDLLVGRDHGGPSFDRELDSRHRLSRIPGTILRLRMPATAISYRHRRPTESSRRNLDFRLVEMGKLEVSGFSPEALKRLQTALSVHDVSRDMCVIAVVDGGPEDSHSLQSALRQSVEIRHPATLVVAGLPGGWNLIDNAIDAINAEHERDERNVEAISRRDWGTWDPVLVIGPMGEGGWVGASADLLRMIQRLETEGPQSVSDVELMRSSEALAETTLRQIHSDKSLFSFDSGNGIHLKITSNVILQTFSRLLAEHVARGEAGVVDYGRLMCTPSLHVVRRWLHVDEVVNAIGGPRIVMMALFKRLVDQLKWRGTQGPNFVITDSTNYLPNVALLQEYLGIDQRLRDVVPGETAAPIPPMVRLIPRDSRVLLHSDIVSSGETIRRCARQALRDGAQVLAISCVIDARLSRDKGVEVWGLEIPVIALSGIDLLVKDGEAGGWISPVTFEPEHEFASKEEPNFPIAPEALDELIREQNALYFSHVGRPIGRHFTFYIDGTRLLSSAVVREAFNKSISDWVGHDGSAKPIDPSRGIEVWYVQSEPSLTASKRIADNLQAQRNDIRHCRPIRRRHAYGQWVFAEGEPTSILTSDVVVVDWGALTGNTIIQMIRLAAERGAERVLACVFLSQLSKDDERLLTMLEELSVPISAYPTPQVDLFSDSHPLQQSAKSPSPPTRKIAVRVRFLARFPIEAYNASDCPVCQQLGRLSRETYPSDIFERFAHRQERDRLVQRSLETTLQDPPKDLDNRPIPADSLLWMSSLRRRLVEAMSWTQKRVRISNELDDILEAARRVANPDKQHAIWLMHFLSIESQWLRKPPLYLWHLREQIANIALEVSLDKSLPEIDRINAVVVMRTCSKPIFAVSLGIVFESAERCPDLMIQLLYDAFTYLTRPYHQQAKVFEPIEKSLVLVTRYCDRPELRSGEIAEAALRLRRRAQAELAKAHAHTSVDGHGSHASRAWGQLRDLFGSRYEQHDPVPESMRRLRPTSNEIDAIDEFLKQQILGGKSELPEKIVLWIRSLERTWNVCLNFLDNQVMPFLVLVRPAFCGEDAERKLKIETRERLLLFIDKSKQDIIPIAESSFSILVRQLARDPKEFLTQSNWERYRRDCDWFWNEILRPQTDDGNMAPVISFLMAAPAELVSTFNEVWEELGRVSVGKIRIKFDELSGRKWAVYCPEELLRDLFRLMLENVTTHAKAPHEQSNVWIQIRREEQRIVFQMKNDNFDTRPERGQAIERAKRRMAAFNAQIKTDIVDRDANARYQVSLEFDELE